MNQWHVYRLIFPLISFKAHKEEPSEIWLANVSFFLNKINYECLTISFSLFQSFSLSAWVSVAQQIYH